MPDRGRAPYIAGVSPDRVPDATVATDRPGRVLTVEPGLVRVRCGGRVVRATVGADLLAAMARDVTATPRPGDRVLVRTWADGRATVERVVVRRLREGPQVT